MNTMNTMNKLQYTIRNVPEAVDKVIRNRVKREGKSFNAVVLDTLMMQTLGSTDVEKASEAIFARLFGANTLDSNFDLAIEEQSKVDEKIWR